MKGNNVIRFRKILCPVDFFPASERAATLAATFARNYSAELKLIHVVPPILPTAYESLLNTAEVTQSVEEQSQRRLDTMSRKLKLSGISVETQVQAGDIFTQIKKTIQAYKPDLVAMGTHGHRGFERWILGSTADRVLRSSPVPMLMISSSQKAGSGARFRRIMVTTDLSNGTAKVLDYALSIAQVNQASITLVHILEEMRALTSAQYRNRRAKGVQRELLKLVPEDVKDWCDIETRIGAGTAYHVILTMLKKEKTDLLVMNTHGKGMVDRALLGSTTERIVRATPCPVMLIPPAGKKI
jgi:nucleotide-binding universal stress UspA family protein